MKTLIIRFVPVFALSILFLTETSSSDPILTLPQQGAVSMNSVHSVPGPKSDNSFVSGTGSISLHSSYLSTPISYVRTLPLTKLAVVAGITAGIYQYDTQIHDWSQTHRTAFSSKIASFVEPLGGTQSLTPAGLMYVFGYMTNDPRAKSAAVLGVKSVLISSFVTASIKTYSHRHRPNSGDPYNSWDGPSASLNNLSFPSGHSTAAFALATVFAEQYNDSMFIPPLAYGLASLTALSRVHDNKHWASDIFLGSAIGYITAKTIMLINMGHDRSFSIHPYNNEDATGLLWDYRF